MVTCRNISVSFHGSIRPWSPTYKNTREKSGAIRTRSAGDRNRCRKDVVWSDQWVGDTRSPVTIHRRSLPVTLNCKHPLLWDLAATDCVTDDTIIRQSEMQGVLYHEINLREAVPVRYRYSSKHEESGPSYTARYSVDNRQSPSEDLKIPKFQLFSRSYSPANNRTIIYVVDPIKRTTEEKRDKR